MSWVHLLGIVTGVRIAGASHRRRVVFLGRTIRRADAVRPARDIAGFAGPVYNSAKADGMTFQVNGPTATDAGCGNGVRLLRGADSFVD
jgi:hypothetical protein